MKGPLRVAVADDEPEVRDYLGELLPRLGHEVVVAVGDGRQLVEACRAAAVDLVITDIKMPGMDGMEAAEAINRARPTPVILVSAHHDTEYLSRLQTDYIMGYLIKPVDEPQLRATIALALTRFEHFQTLTREAADLRQALEDRKLIERAKGVLMKRLRVDEEDAFRRLRRYASDQNLKLVDVGRRIVGAEEVFHQLDRV